MLVEHLSKCVEGEISMRPYQHPWKIRWGLIGLLSSGILSACGPKQEMGGDSSLQAVVSQNQADEAFAIVYQLDYLPFNYIEDGCYARELYMSMELASDRIPSSAQYIYGNLRPTDDTRWSYHVAPLLKVGEEEPWVLDPAFEDEPLRLKSWIGKNFPAGRYRTAVKAGSAYFDKNGRTSDFNDKRMVKNFEEMPTFLTSDIASACNVMYSYIAREGEDIEYKRIKLLNRTAELVHDLARESKLEVRSISSRINARCREAIAQGQQFL